MQPAHARSLHPILSSVLVGIAMGLLVPVVLGVWIVEGDPITVARFVHDELLGAAGVVLPFTVLGGTLGGGLGNWVRIRWRGHPNLPLLGGLVGATLGIVLCFVYQYWLFITTFTF